MIKLCNPMINCVTRCAMLYFLLIWCNNLSLGYTNFNRVMQFKHQVTNSSGDNLKHKVTLVPSGADVVCHMLQYRGYCVFGGWFINFVVSCTSCTIRIKVILKTYVVHPPLKYFFFFFARDACLKGQTYFIHFCFLFPVICFISSEMFWFFSLSRWNLSNRKNVVVSYKKVI